MNLLKKEINILTEQIKDYLNKYKIDSEESLAQHIEELKRYTVPNNELIFPLVEVLLNEKDSLISFFRENKTKKAYEVLTEIVDKQLTNLLHSGMLNKGTDTNSYLPSDYIADEAGVWQGGRSIDMHWNSYITDMSSLKILSEEKIETPLKFTALDNQQEKGHSTRHKANNMGHRLVEEEIRRKEEKVFKNWETTSTHDQTIINSLNENIEPYYETNIENAIKYFGKKETENKVDYSEIDWDFIKGLAQRMNKNKEKYEPFNYHKPMDVNLLKQSLLRHVLEIMKGIDDDAGQEFGHYFATALNSMMIFYQLKNNQK